MTHRNTHRQPSGVPDSLSAPARLSSLDRFELREELGAGATGTVWRAWDHHRSTEVALKILHQVDTTVMRRFKQEFRTLADLRHPNIVRFHELFEVEEQLFFSMELIDGVDLLSWIWGYRHDEDASRGDDRLFEEDTKPNLTTIAGPKVDHARLRSVFAQLVDGLAQLHAVGTLHRDLKPSNLMVRRDGRLSILDFGLAVSLQSSSGRDRQAAVGTIAYMAPEVAEQRSADASADYYGVGVLLFEALTGRTPFPGERIGEILAAKITSEAPVPSSLVPGVPPELDRLCGALLCRDPVARAGADELNQAFVLDRVPAEDPIGRLARGSGAILRPPVVGRNREVDLLTADLAAVASVGMQCRLVIGPSGIGKTALAEAFTRRLSAQATVLMGRCHDRETIPFRAIDEVVDALAHYLSGLPDEERARLAPARADLLAELFPVLRGLGDRQPRNAERDPGLSRLQSFAALRDLLAAVGRRTPLALVIDDLHLADPDSLDLLDQVFRGEQAPPLLLVGLGRPGAVMDQICSLAVKDGGCLHKLELGPLQSEEATWVARTLASYMDVELSDPGSVAIDTGGHPGFTVEILRAASHTHPPAGSSVPALESVLAMRIFRQSEPTRRVLELLSVAGGLCSVELAAQVLGTSVGEVAAALDDLVDADLVVATGRSQEDAFEFYHERIREVAEATLSAETITAINHALADGLESRGGTDATRMLRLWELAGDPRRAAHYRTILAGRARAAYEFQRAALLHETTLRDPISLTLECQVRTELAELYGFLGRLADSAAEYLAASRLCGFDRGLELQRCAAEALLYAADVEAGGRVIEDVLAALGRSAPRPRWLQLLVSLKSSATRTLRGGSFAARDPQTVAPRESLILDALATASISIGVLEPLRGRVYQQQHLEAARQVGDSVRYARALCVEAAGLASAGTGNRPQVELLLDEAVAVSAGNSPRRRAEVLLGHAIAAFLLGDFARARIAIDRCLFKLEADNRSARWALRQARSYASWIYWMTGDYVALGRDVPTWAAEALTMGDRFTYTLMTTSTSNQAWLLVDDVAGAEQRIEEAERMWSLRSAPIMRWHMAAARANLELYRGCPHKALAALQEVAPVARGAELHRVEFLRLAMAHLNLRAHLAMAAAAPREAAPHLTAARTLTRTLASSTAPWARALASLAAATVIEHSGSQERALLRYAESARALRDADLAGYANAASWRAAHLMGGLPGDAQKVAIAAASLALGVRDPRRFYDHLIGA